VCHSLPVRQPQQSHGTDRSKAPCDPQRDVWRFENKAGEVTTVARIGPLRVTNVDALIPTLLAGLAIPELPEFAAFDLLRMGQVEALLPDWSMALGGLYFVTPTTRARSAKVEALSSFLTERLSQPEWHVDPPGGRSTKRKA
jgi:DNA-binding transcriptional LysR family regulator